MQRHHVVRLRFILIVAILSAVGLMLFSVTTDKLMMPTPLAPTIRPADTGDNLVQARAYPSLSYGVHIFGWWDHQARQTAFEFTRLMRFGYVKQIFSWSDIQPDSALPFDFSQADEVVAEAQYRKIKLLARLGKPPAWAIRTLDRAVTNSTNDIPPFDVVAFGNYCGALATRYKGQIAGYQVWNEPNLAREWNTETPNARAYVTLLRACYTQIKANDPDAVVISAGLAPTGTLSSEVIPDETYLISMYQAGLRDCYDVLGVHAPGYGTPPEIAPDDPSLNGDRWKAFRHVEDIRALQVYFGDGAKQLAILEMGWTTDTRETVIENGQTVVNPYRWHAVTEAQQADYLVRAYQYAGQHWRPWMGLMVTIYLADQDWTPDREEWWWAVATFNNGIQVRPAFVDLSNMPRYVDDQFIPPYDPGKPDFTPMPARPTATRGS